jgi:phage major head subunit gpT-like protein
MTNPKTKTNKLSVEDLGRLKLEADVKVEIEAAAEGEAPKRPRFSIVAYTGGPIEITGFYTPIILELKGIRANRDNIPIFLDHDPSRIVGQTDEITIDSSGVRLTGLITGDDADASKIITHAKNGFQWQASIGAGITRKEVLKAGEKATVNGREVSGPILIARESKLFETSFVAIGADSQAEAMVASARSLGSKYKGVSMFDVWLEAKGFDPAALDDTQKVSLQAMYDVDQAKTKENNKASQTLDQIVEARRKEDERVGKITEIAADSMNDRPTMTDEFEKMAKSAIEAKSSVQEFELAVMRVRARVGGGNYNRGADPKTTSDVIEAALCLAGGIDSPEKRFDEKTLHAAQRRFPQGLSLVEFLTLAARENGYSGYSSKDIRGLLQAAYGNDTVRANQGFSTLSIPGILSNTANKFLTAGFNAVESSWREVTAIRPVRDFKTVTSYALTGDALYEKVGAGGEIKHGTLGEQSYTIRAETYGKMFAITRQDLINDDLGSLTQIPRKLGRGAALALTKVFWTEFLADVSTFYTTARGNAFSGAGSALQASSLKTANERFLKQTDPDGNPLGLAPRILLVPPELAITAAELMQSINFNTGGAATGAQIPNANVFAGRYQVVVSSYLSNTTVTGNSATAWFLLADPQDLAVIEVAFLNGRDTPIVESADVDFNVLGIQFRGYHDFGTAKQEYRAGVRAAGA